MDLHPFPAYTKQKLCRYGLMLYNVHDIYVGRSFDLYGEFSEGETAIFDQIVTSGQVVLDIGANIGAHTLFFARKVGPTGAVAAFEPQRQVFQMLCANLALNSVPNVLAYQMALGTRTGEIFVPALDYTQDENYGGLELGGWAQGERVPLRTLDSLDLARCDFIKLDVEGMEEEVLRGAAGLLARCRPVLYVENDRPEKSDGLIRFIASLGYRMHWHRPPLYNPDNFAGNPDNVFGAIVSCNMLCIPQEQEAKVHGMPAVEIPS